ncbi:FAD-dependent oxidoreductase [Emticicia sp. SJ17W-69]|uniref:FAD-dependent oxidoreductase n=1 Tax=Emticicia sp. SJ17W-69 TaxID=3421657 RepID=UPI003EC0EAC5
MKRFFFKLGIFLEIVLFIGHLYVLRNGLPIPAKDGEGRELILLLRTYEISLFGAEHTVDQILAGYDYSWAALVFFGLFASIITLCVPLHIKKAKIFTCGKTLMWLVCFIIAYNDWGKVQQILLFTLFLTFLLSYLFDWNQPKQKDTKICIVGGGISGLTAAYQLQKQGYSNITVFEKSDKVGGKCLTNITDWKAFDLGGHEMLAGYGDLIQIAEEIATPTRTSVPPLVYDTITKKYLNFNQAASITGKYSTFEVMLAALKYLYIVGIEFNSFSQPSTGYKNVPAELCVDLEAWLKQRNLLALSDILSFVIKAQGYGGYADGTAAYLVKFMGFKNWFSLLVSGIGLTKKWPRVFVYGAQNFCERLAATVPDVRLNSTIQRIERNNAETQNGIKVFLENQDNPIFFDYLIVSTPLDAPSISLKYLELTEVEKSLFDQLQTIDAYTTLCEIQGLPTGVVANLPLNDLQKGEYTGFIKDFADEPVALFLSLAKPEMTGEYILDEIRKVIARIPPYYGVQPAMIKNIQQKRWRYFPHVTKEALANGFYDKIEAIQGQNQTFYASSALSFENLGNCVAYTKRLITKNF